METLVIPDSVTTIGNEAFNNCKSVKNLTIGSGVETIGENAFADVGDYASALNVTIKATTPPTASTPFYGCSKLQLIMVPAASLDAYESASGWSEYTDKIIAE
jgi:hypothetical protein